MLNDDNYLKFINTNPTIPKVLYLTDKKRIPISIKALSNTFKGKLSFGVIY